MGPIFHEQNAISPFQSTAYCENKDLKVVVHVYRVEMNGFYRTPDIWRGNHTFATKRSEISPIKRANLLTITTTPKNWNNRKKLTPTSRSFYTRKGLWTCGWITLTANVICFLSKTKELFTLYCCVTDTQILPSRGKQLILFTKEKEYFIYESILPD